MGQIINKNKSYVMLLPLLRLESHMYIINTYIGDMERNTLKNKLYVLCNRHNPYIEKKYIVEDIRELDSGKIMYEIDFPEEFNDDFIKFLNGKYSEMSKRAKDIICKYNAKYSNKEIQQTSIYSILYKTKARKKFLEDLLGVTLEDSAELCSIINLEEEIYGYKHEI